MEEIFLGNINNPFVLLEGTRLSGDAGRSFIFSSCKDVLVLNAPRDVDKFFMRAESYIERGLWLAGFFSYEFGYCLENRLIKYMPAGTNLPLAWLGVFENPSVFLGEHAFRIKKQRRDSAPRIKQLKPAITNEEYQAAIKRIKYYIERGETYQVNFTFPLRFKLNGAIAGLYKELRQAQPTDYSAFINTGKDFILSFSPELFFRLKGRRIVTMPMKGTISRGYTLKDDNNQCRNLKRSVKNRAENIMIVDLLRNDLGRIAKTGSVKVSKLFSLEKYTTLWQMTSTIEANIRNGITLKDIFKSLFPCGSVTGAPKIRTMQIIRKAEKYPRGVYCGAIGYISPRREMCFNVAIRTIYLDNKGHGVLGIGGGIVYDSKDKSEYDEAILKARFFVRKQHKFSLIETMLWNTSYYLLDYHLNRLRRSCEYFDIPFREYSITDRLNHLVPFFDKKRRYKVRLLLNHRGSIRCFYSPLANIVEPVSIMLSADAVYSDNLYLYHKTTNRRFYDKQRKRSLGKGAWESIFINERNELTEGSITNIFILKNNKLFTPPVSCGLLPGVLREYLLRSAKAEEKVLYPKDLLGADKIYIGNSVRGLIEAGLKDA